jgi:hypothetical protein
VAPPRGAVLAALRWCCGTDGTVVVSQDVRWSDSETGRELGRAVVAPEFHVHNGVIARYARHEDLATALEAASLTPTAEVTSRA